jgi:nitric oxide reductase NorE protein
MSTFVNRSQGAKSSGEIGRHVPGETGTWVFIFGDMVIFAVFFATYLYYRLADPLLFERSQRSLNPDYGAFNTVVLLVSSLLIVMAVRAVRLRAGNLARPLIAGAFACGLVFSALKVVEWSEKIHAGLTPAKT